MQTRPLFGGSMSISTPSSMVDMSEYRQVPDHQEVFADATTGASLIVELLAREGVVEDDHAGAFYFIDLAKANQSRMEEDDESPLETHPLPSAVLQQAALAQVELSNSGGDNGAAAAASRMVALCCSYSSLTTGMQRISKYTNEVGKENDVFVGVILFRLLPPVSTDILVSLSAPLRIHRESSEAQAIKRFLSKEERDDILNEAAASLMVRDWNLFVPEE